MDNEQALITRAQGGDTVAFKVLVQANQRQVFNMAMELTGNWSDADDLAQIVFIKAYKGLGRFKGGSKFLSWVYRIMVNAHIDETRKQKTHGGYDLSPTTDDGADRDDLFVDDSAAHDPARQMEASHMQTDIEHALQTLAPQQKAIFVMRHYKDMPLKDIAHALGVTTGTVKSQLFRALQHMQKNLAVYRTELGLETS